RDMATLSLRIQRDFPEYYPYFRTMSFTYRGQVIRTHNHLLGHYAGVDGIKTGYVAASGFNLTSSAKRGDKRVVGVVMGAASATSRNLYMMAMLDKAFPKCKDGTAIAVAVEGVKPKSEPAQVEEAEATPPPLKKTTGKAKKATAPPVPAKSDDEDAAEEEGGNETSGVEKPVETASAEAQDTQEAPADPPVGQTVLSKTSPDGTPLPFAVKKPGDDEGGIVVIPDAGASWHIQIGAYPSKKDAQGILYKIKELDLDLVDKKQALTVEVQKGKDTLYRARFSGFTEQDARTACDRLTRQGFGCVAMQPQS